MLYNQSVGSSYWPSSIVNNTRSYSLYMGSTRLSKVDTGNKRIGDTMRCIFGTNRTNATARDNLMTGASLGYSGFYEDMSLNKVGIDGRWWSSTIYNTSYSHYLAITTNNSIQPRGWYNKYVGRSVRDATQSDPDALTIAIRFNQARTIHKQAVTTGATNYTRGPVVAIQRLEVKPTRTPVIVARIYIRQWIRSCTKATSGVE